MEFLLIFWTNRLSAQFPTITRSEVYLRQESLKLRQSSNWAANLFKIWQNSNAAFVVFYLFFIIYQKTIVWIVTICWIIEDASVMNFYLPPVSTKSESASQTDNHFYNIPPTSVYQTIICLLYVKSLRNLKILFNWQIKQILI